MADGYTADDASLLHSIREDILARPAFYGEGAGYLSAQHGPEKTRQAAVAEWQELKNRLGSMAEDPPKEARWSWAACAGRAFNDLSTPNDGHDDERAKAICLLAVLLWDHDADKRHPLFDVFGPWGVTPAGQIDSLGRGAAANNLLAQGGESLRQWLDIVAQAWNGLPKDRLPAVAIALPGTLEPTLPGPQHAPRGDVKHETIQNADQRTTPFDAVDPHRHLPDDAKLALWNACEIVLARPDEFAEGVAWLSDEYSEAAIRDRLLRDSERMYRVALRQLVHDGDRCNTFPRRKVLRAARPDLPRQRRLKLLRHFWSCPEIKGVSEDFAQALLEYPEKVREWVMQLTIQTMRFRGSQNENGQVVPRSYADVGDKGLPDASTVEIYWRWKDEQTRQTLQELKAARRERDGDCRKRAKDRVGRLRQAVADAMEAGLPAGREERMHARRVVLLACLMAYQHELSLPGEFGAWRWESTGSLLVTSPDETYVAGRETVLFGFAYLRREPFNAGLVHIDVERFAALVRRALSLCGVKATPSANVHETATNSKPELRSWPQVDLDNTILQSKAGAREDAVKTEALAGEGTQRKARARGKRWLEVKTKAEKIVQAARGKFPGIRPICKHVNCAPGTLYKAIEHSPYLSARYAEYQKKTTARAPDDVELADLIAEQNKEREADARLRLRTRG